MEEKRVVTNAGFSRGEGAGHTDRSLLVDVLRALREADRETQWRMSIEQVDDTLGLLERRAREEMSTNQIALVWSFLMTVLAEAGQYRFETMSSEKKQELGIVKMLQDMDRLRGKAVNATERLLARPEFGSIYRYVEQEIVPLLRSLSIQTGGSVAGQRYMPFRIIQIGNIVERLFAFRARTPDPTLIGSPGASGLLDMIYEGKYLRFGTSGVRGRWGFDFTETSAKRFAQAICDLLRRHEVPSYVPGTNLSGRLAIIGYDARREAARVARWVAEVFLGNGFPVHVASRDTPTPALVFYLTELVESDRSAALINCTASHNPPEWQGIKFNPKEGYPAPTALTDFIAARANELFILGFGARTKSMDGVDRDLVEFFDPIGAFTDWILKSGEGNERIGIDRDAIRRHFSGGHVIVDEMHGSGRGYLTRLLGACGVGFRVLRGERDENLGGQAYANPEEPFLEPLKQAVLQGEGALLGVALDTDADRFGVVDRDGTYYRPNQVLPMLVRYLGLTRGIRGRVVVTQTGSPLAEILAGEIKNNEDYRPGPGAIPSYINHPFFVVRTGEVARRSPENVFLVPVGIKYIEEQRLTDRFYRSLPQPPAGWRDVLLIGGEESSGLTTKGHVTDKDGIWANLLIMDMVAHYGKTLGEIWRDTVHEAGVEFFGGRESRRNCPKTGRVDVDAVLEVKEELINRFLDSYGELIEQAAFPESLELLYVGGVRFDFVELELRDAGGGLHYLRVRASGTEPINRIYVESSDPEVAAALMEMALTELESLSRKALMSAESPWRVSEILTTMEPSEQRTSLVREFVHRRGLSAADIRDALQRLVPILESRNAAIAREWCRLLQ